MRGRPIFAALVWLVATCCPALGENLILISVGTLRADQLGCYGSITKTPGADGWAEQGVLFEQAYTPVPLTLPSQATLLTGTLPIYHGVRDDVGFRLPADQVTLAEILREAGYETSAFISSSLLGARSGLSQGFDRFDPDSPDAPEPAIQVPKLREAAETTGRAIEWLRQRGEKPFFLWLQLADTLAANPPASDESVAEIDRQLKRLEEFLQQSNLLAGTHLVLVSDRGAGRGEHGESTAGLLVYDSTLRVPWIIRPAASTEIKSHRIGTPFSLVDVVPTLLQLLRLPLPEQLQGQSAYAEINGGTPTSHPLYAESYLAALRFGWSRLKAIRVGQYKYIDAPAPELYDLEKDPGETRNLAGQDSERAAQLREQLSSLQARYQSLVANQAIVSSFGGEAARAAAGAGGSIASGAVVDETPRGIDPKTRVATYERYHGIVSRLGQPQPALLEQIRELRRADPDLPGTDFLEGICLEKLGDFEGARVAYLKELEARPDNRAASLSLAGIHLRLNEAAEAHLLYQEAVEVDPDNYLARNQLGLLWRLRGFNEQAAEEFQTVTTQAPTYVLGWINYGSTLALMGKLDEAEKAFRKAIEVDPSFAEAHFHLSRVLETSGRLQEAMLERELAARLDPRFRP